VLFKLTFVSPNEAIGSGWVIQIGSEPSTID
jgi:hypothetical protein